MKNFLNYLEICNSFNINEFIPILYNTYPIGFIHKENLQHISKHSKLFSIKKTEIHIILSDDDQENSVENLTAKFEIVNKHLIEQNVFLETHDGEFYRVSLGNFSSPIFSVRRSSIGFWGFRVYGVHLNGLVNMGKNNLHMWVARRNKNKPAGGLKDHIVCGGQPSNMTLEENLRKEAEEEAEIPNNIIKQSKAVGAVSCWVQTGTFLNRFTPFMFDLMLPNNFVPKNSDNSVAKFHLDNLVNLVSNPDELAEFKSSCYPVLISLLIRHGYIKPDDPLYLSLCAMLSNGFYANQILAY